MDMDTYRVEKRAARKILLPGEDAEIEPAPTTDSGHKPEPELDHLSENGDDQQSQQHSNDLSPMQHTYPPIVSSESVFRRPMLKSPKPSKANDLTDNRPEGTAPRQRAGQDRAIQTILDALANLTPEQLTTLPEAVRAGIAAMVEVSK